MLDNAYGDPTGRTFFNKIADDRNLLIPMYAASVLYVEDNLWNQEFAKQVFANIGCQVKIANDGREALEMIIKERFDLVLMDLDMPRLNGYEATVIIRQNLCLKIPIIALTTLDTEAHMENCKLVGMNDHMAKPLNQDQLIEKISEWKRR